MDISKKFLSKEKLDCSLLCAEPFASFRRHEKKRKERLEKEYKFKAVRLKTAGEYKGLTQKPTFRTSNPWQSIELHGEYCVLLSILL